MLHKKLKNLVIAISTIGCSAIFANGGTQQDLQTTPTKLSPQPIAALPMAKQITPDRIDLETRPWSIMLYAGNTTKTELGQIIKGQYSSAHETLYSAELAYTLSKENIIRRIFSPLVSTVQLAGNVAYRIEHRSDAPKNPEGDLYIVFRWTNFPWNNYVTTTLAAAEGISYVAHVPYEETHGVTSDDSRRLLNFLMFEATFAMPSHPEWQLLARIHHRSTAYGVFGNTNGGSNNIGLGIRYYFNF